MPVHAHVEARKDIRCVYCYYSLPSHLETGSFTDPDAPRLSGQHAL